MHCFIEISKFVIISVKLGVVGFGPFLSLPEDTVFDGVCLSVCLSATLFKKL